MFLLLTKQIRLRILFIGSLMLGFPLFAHADLTSDETITFNDESPAARDLLIAAVGLERNDAIADGDWQAANLYCQASRIGSAEAQYRLGMLYAFGQGVPKNRELAASLFAVAASHGHQESQKMLETIEISTTELPACVLEAVAPEKAPVVANLDATNGQGIGAIDAHLSKLPKNKRWIINLVQTMADWYQVDSKLILSVIAVESDFTTKATSPKDAMGLMQLIPATAERFNIKNAYTAAQNVKGGIAYMRWLLAYFRGDVQLAVAGYNAGEHVVDRYKGVPPYPETKQYVKKIMHLYGRHRHPYDQKLTAPSPLVKS